jgi:hypothetical protein
MVPLSFNVPASGVCVMNALTQPKYIYGSCLACGCEVHSLNWAILEEDCVLCMACNDEPDLTVEGVD